MTERKPPLYPFIERDPEQDNCFWIDHEELGGKKRFRCKRPMFGVKRQLEQIKAELLASPYPTEEGEAQADMAATLLAGLEVSPFTPEGDKPAIILVDDVLDEDLIRAVYSEVWSYWATFRVTRQA